MGFLWFFSFVQIGCHEAAAAASDGASTKYCPRGVECVTRLVFVGVSRRQVGLVERRALAHEAQVNSQVDATLHLSIVLMLFSLSAARLSLCLGQVKVSNSFLGFSPPGCSCSAVFAQPRAAAAAAAAAARPVSYAKAKEERGMKGVKVEPKSS